MKSKVLVIGTSFFAVGIVVAAASVNIANAQTYSESLRLLTYSEGNVDLVAEADDFEARLPDGVDWPTLLPEQFNSPDSRLQDGVPEVILAQYWLCAWENETLRHFAAGENTETAFAYVQSFTTLQAYQRSFVDPENGWIRDVVEPARAGDFTGMQADFNNSCGYFVLNNPSSS